MPTVNTARGPVETSELGRTFMHEHIAIRGTDVFAHWPELDEAAGCLEAATTRFAELDERGVGTVVDVTPANLGRDIALIEQVQASTDVNIIVATGMYWNIPLYWQGRDPDEMADAFVREIEQGIGETSVRAGIIKLASHVTLDEANEAALRAAARAQPPHRRADHDARDAAGVRPGAAAHLPRGGGGPLAHRDRAPGQRADAGLLPAADGRRQHDRRRQLRDRARQPGLARLAGPHRAGRRALRGRLRGPHRARARQHVLHRLGAGAGAARGQPELDLDLHPGRDRPRHARSRHQRGPAGADARRQPRDGCSRRRAPTREDSLGRSA